MNQRRSLQPHEIRIIKIDRKAILELIWEILSDIRHEKFCLPRNVCYAKRICFDWIFDDELCEFIFWVQRNSQKINKESIISSIRNNSIDTIESLLSNPSGKRPYCSIQNTLLDQVRFDENMLIKSFVGKLYVQIRPLGKHEVRVIRLSLQAVEELLWEHFMETADQIMELPEEEIGDLRTIYHMYIEGQLEKLTLYVMNFNEASDEAFMANQEYCKKNIGFTTNSYLKQTTKGQCYVSVVLSNS